MTHSSHRSGQRPVFYLDGEQRGGHSLGRTVVVPGGSRSVPGDPSEDDKGADSLTGDCGRKESVCG